MTRGPGVSPMLPDRSTAVRNCQHGVSGSSRGLHRVEIVLDYLRGGWRSGQRIVEHVKHLSGQIGEQTAYNSSNGAARNARSLAKRRGLAWWTLDVNRDESGPAAPGMGGHRLYCVMRRNERSPHHRAMEAGAEPVGDPPLSVVRAEDLVNSTEDAIAKLRDGRMASRGALTPEIAGSTPAPAAKVEITQGRLFG